VDVDEAITVSAWCFFGHWEKVGKSDYSQNTQTAGTVGNARNILQGRQIDLIECVF